MEETFNEGPEGRYNHNHAKWGTLPSDPVNTQERFIYSPGSCQACANIFNEKEKVKDDEGRENPS